MTPKESYKKWYEANKERARKMKREKMREYRAANPEKHRKISRDAKARLRKKIYDLYGESCVLCGFTNLTALTLDHILGNGKIERELLGERGVYLRATRQYLPNEYRILCMNCQFIERERLRVWLDSHGGF